MSEFKPVVLTLPSSFTPSLALEILPYGLTIHRLLVRDDNRTHDLVIGPELSHDHVTQKYTNSVVGRYANRVPVGTHPLERDGIKNSFTALSNENELVSLHGGPVGFDAVPWTLLSEGDHPTLFSAAEVSNLTPSESTVPSYAFFRLISVSGDQGFPGKLVIEALIALIGPVMPQGSVTTSAEDSVGSIVIVYRAKLDEGPTKVVTPINLTQHWGFNLDASLQDGPDYLSIQNYMLTIKADRIAELGPHALATGRFVPISSLPSHDHSPKRIGDRFPPGGYDDYYAFTNKASIPTRIPLSDFKEKSDLLKGLLCPTGNGGDKYRVAPVVEVSSAKSGFKLVFDTNQHGVMFYSNNMADPSKGARKKIHGGSGIPNGDAYGHSSAVFLEFHQVCFELTFFF
ncbi:galactose mutarotase-like protein [Phlegmacium glaucopus]|nr:galactose mutarotase-like protein [Phlegmacium glaucopus]